MTMLNKPASVKHTIKDSVFRDLFSQPQYLLQLYQALHPEDTSATENDLAIITLHTAMTNGIYNDLGFQVNDRLIVLIEAQSTWSENIIIRSLLYLAYTYKNLFQKEQTNLYSSKKINLPFPELYVIYTGEQKNKPSSISLKNEFFNGRSCCLDVSLKVICLNNEMNIINQYIIFCRVASEQIRLHGRTTATIKEIIRICKDMNVLKAYLTSREKEVSDIMFILFDDEEIMRNYQKELIADATAEGMEKGMKKGMEKGMEKGEISGVKKLIAAGITSFEAIKASGLYTPSQLEALQQ